MGTFDINDLVRPYRLPLPLILALIELELLKAVMESSPKIIGVIIFTQNVIFVSPKMIKNAVEKSNILFTSRRVKKFCVRLFLMLSLRPVS